MPETSIEKVGRLLAHGRVTLRRLEAGYILARVRGDSAAEYNTGWDPAGWFCSCPASPGLPHRPCSHVRAVQLVALEPLPNVGTGKEGVAG